MNTTDIAWRAHACPLDTGTVYLGIGPAIQHRAAVEVLTDSGVMVRSGSCAIVTDAAQATPLSLLSLPERVFKCFEAGRLRPQDGFRPVTLACRLESDAADRYLRRAAELSEAGDFSDAEEAGFVGAAGLPTDLEEAFFAGLPGEPLPLSEFLAVVAHTCVRLSAR